MGPTAFATALFLNSALLFLMEPLFAKRALPYLGGSPQVWNTCIVFYQTALLAGYAWAHFLDSRTSRRGQALAHTAVMLAGAAALGTAWRLPDQLPGGDPVLWLLGRLTLTIGLPFFALSANSPLLQRWCSRACPDTGRDPYRLFSVSNLASLLALCSYPLLIEPGLTLSRQIELWRYGYWLAVLLTAGCAVMLWISPGQGPAAGVSADSAVPLSSLQRARWVLLAFIPSSLMLGLTTHLTTDLAPIPLLWVVPLAIYLLTFVFAFGRPGAPITSLFAPALPFFVIALLFLRDVFPHWIMLGLHLAGFAAAAQVCHGRLAGERPSPGMMTEYYFWLVLGGALGGLFNALLAPLIFPSVVEYPLVLLLAAFVCARNPAGVALAPWPRLPSLAALGILVAAGLTLRSGRQPLWPGPLALRLAVLAALCAAAGLHRRRFLLSGVLAGIVILRLLGDAGEGRLLLARRSFFGVYKVVYDPVRQMNMFFHGSTRHGVQSRDPRLRGEPVGSYYDRDGPVGGIFALYRRLGWKKPIGVIGLGVGTMTAYAEPGEPWTFYEIDPEVESIARNGRYFSYLKDSRAPVSVVLGDARLSLQKEPDRRFGMIVVDAFGSDAIPMHLLTREAFALYLAKLSPDGVLVFHITNRYLDLLPPLRDLAHNFGLRVAADKDPGLGEGPRARSRSQWILATNNKLLVAQLFPGETGAPEPPRGRLWSDDYSDLVSAFKFY